MTCGGDVARRQEQAPGREAAALLGWTTSGGLLDPPSVGAAASGTAVLATPPFPAPRSFDWPGAASRNARKGRLFASDRSRLWGSLEAGDRIGERLSEYRCCLTDLRHFLYGSRFRFV